MDIEDAIREAVKLDHRPDPSPKFHSRVMASIPDRTRSARWPAPALSDFARFAALAAILAVAFAAVGLPLMQSKPGSAAPGESAPSSTAAVGAVGTESASTRLVGQFTSTGAMMTSATPDEAVLLADGRVLAMYSYYHGAPTPELYDPATGKFSLTGSMSADRSGETATRLLDGRVLITGGTDSAGAGLASAELFDPKTGKFSPTGSMTTARYHHTSTLLSDGRVLIAGGYHVTDIVRQTSEGYGAAGEALASAELYDPASGTFSPTGSMNTARFSHTAVSLVDGRVLVIGGLAVPDGLASAEVYDPVSGEFSPTGSMPDGREAYSATLLSDGRVLISGGFINNRGGQPSDVPTAELYDPGTGRFTQAGAMTHPRHNATATQLADGRVLVAGGATYAKGTSEASAELYDPATGKFSAAGSMSRAREMHTATLLLDGRVLMAGGLYVTTTTDELDSAEIYEP